MNLSILAHIVTVLATFLDKVRPVCNTNVEGKDFHQVALPRPQDTHVRWLWRQFSGSAGADNELGGPFLDGVKMGVGIPSSRVFRGSWHSPSQNQNGTQEPVLELLLKLEVFGNALLQGCFETVKQC